MVLLKFKIKTKFETEFVFATKPNNKVKSFFT